MSLGSVSWHIPFDELDIQDQIGGGGFSLVYRGFWKGTPVAVKRWFDPNLTDELMQEFREEVMTHEPLRHPNVVQFLGACMKPPNLCLVMEHLPHSLHNVLYNSNVELDKKRIVTLALDMVRALWYLHSRKPAVIHRDIKPANFLVDRAWKVKICDFGLAANTRKQVGAGTPAYMAPELLQGGSYNERADVYAFGIVLNEMLTRQPPFHGLSVPEIKSNVLGGERPEMSLSCPRQLEDIIKQCWDETARNRPTFDKVLELLKEANRWI